MRPQTQRGIVFQAYSSLGTQWWGRGYRRNPVLAAPAITGAAAAHGVTPGQVVLRWALHRGQAVIPKSSSEAHIRSNRELGFELSPGELAAVDAMDGVLPPREEERGGAEARRRGLRRARRLVS